MLIPRNRRTNRISQVQSQTWHRRECTKENKSSGQEQIPAIPGSGAGRETCGLERKKSGLGRGRGDGPAPEWRCGCQAWAAARRGPTAHSVRDDTFFPLPAPLPHVGFRRSGGPSRGAHQGSPPCWHLTLNLRHPPVEGGAGGSLWGELKALAQGPVGSHLVTVAGPCHSRQCRLRPGTHVPETPPDNAHLSGAARLPWERSSAHGRRRGINSVAGITEAHVFPPLRGPRAVISSHLPWGSWLEHTPSCCLPSWP